MTTENEGGPSSGKTDSVAVGLFQEMPLEPWRYEPPELTAEERLAALQRYLQGRYALPFDVAAQTGVNLSPPLCVYQTGRLLTGDHAV
jgi:hypothetical protein